MASYVYCLKPFFTKKAAIFPNGGQTNNFRRNISQTKFKDLYVSFTKSQTKSKSESDQQRYGELCILSLAIFHEKAAIFANGGQTNNFRRNIPRQSLKTFMLALQKVKPNPNRSQISRDMASYAYCFSHFSRKRQPFFQMAAKRITLEKNIPRQSLKTF